MTAEIAMTAPTDAEVIARARVEPAAFAAIFDRHHEAIHAYLRRRLDAPIAEELAAETFTRALHGVGRYDHGRADALPWLYTKRREIWLSVDRAGLLRQDHVGPPRWLTPRDRANWIKAGRPDESQGPGSDGMRMGAIHHYLLGDEKFTAAQLRGYDPTPQELYDRLRSRVDGRGQSRNGEVFVEIADALRESPQTPRLRATLYRALALVPGVQLLGNVHDRLGRAAIGVAFTEHTGMRQELLLDPRTAEMLNEREVVAHRVQGIRAAVGTAIEDVVYTRRAVTDSTARP